MLSFFKGLGLGLLCLLCFAAGLAFVELLKGPDDTLAFSQGALSLARSLSLIFSVQILILTLMKI